MTQKEFSKYVLDEILKRFPEFVYHVKLENDIMTIEYPSKLGILNLWITTQDNEITIGFDNKEGTCDWHIHMSQYSAFEPEDELREAINLVNNIIKGKEIIVFKNNKAYKLTKNSKNEVEEKQDDDIIEFKKWDEI